MCNFAKRRRFTYYWWCMLKLTVFIFLSFINCFTCSAILLNVRVKKSFISACLYVCIVGFSLDYYISFSVILWYIYELTCSDDYIHRRSDSTWCYPLYICTEMLHTFIPLDPYCLLVTVWVLFYHEVLLDSFPACY